MELTETKWIRPRTPGPTKKQWRKTAIRYAKHSVSEPEMITVGRGGYSKEDRLILNILLILFMGLIVGLSYALFSFYKRVETTTTDTTTEEIQQLKREEDLIELANIIRRYESKISTITYEIYTINENEPGWAEIK